MRPSLLPVVLLGPLLAVAGCQRGNSPPSGASVPPAPPPKVPATSGTDTLAPLLARVTPGVVSIAVKGEIPVHQRSLLQDPLFRQFFGLGVPQGPSEEPFRGAGSGVIVDSRHGYIVTNNHVIQHATQTTAILADGRRLRAKLVGTDPASDVAIIHVKPDHLTSLSMGDSDLVKVGDFAVAIGNPFGLSHTATFGIVSALGRSGLGIEGYEDFIQTDASINPGNSGGPLVSLTGQVIGLNSAILGGSGGNIGIGFAIPINMVRAVMTQLIAHGKVSRGQLGVFAQTLTPELAKELNNQVQAGAVIVKVIEGSAAAEAGLRPGDVIVSVDGSPVRSAEDLRNDIGIRSVGQKVKLEVVHDGNKKTAEVTIAAVSTAEVAGASIAPLLKGVQLGEIPTNSQGYGRLTGVAVLGVEQDSPAGQAGLRAGDIITSADRQVVGSVRDLKTAIVRGPADAVLLHIIRDDVGLFVHIAS